MVPGCNLERLPAAKSRQESGAIFRGATIRRSRDLLVVGHHHAGLVPVCELAEKFVDASGVVGDDWRGNYQLDKNRRLGKGYSENQPEL